MSEFAVHSCVLRKGGKTYTAHIVWLEQTGSPRPVAKAPTWDKALLVKKISLPPLAVEASACSSNSDCPSPSAPICLEGSCVECTSSRLHCTGMFNPVCNKKSNRCVQCMANGNCRKHSPWSPYCESTMCVQCKAHQVMYKTITATTTRTIPRLISRFCSSCSTATTPSSSTATRT